MYTLYYVMHTGQYLCSYCRLVCTTALEEHLYESFETVMHHAIMKYV